MQSCRVWWLTPRTFRNPRGGPRVVQAHRFKELERENIRLKKLVGDLSLDKAILKKLPRETSKRGKATME